MTLTKYDTTENIRNFLKEKLETHNIKFRLILKDAYIYTCDSLPSGYLHLHATDDHNRIIAIIHGIGK